MLSISKYKQDVKFANGTVYYIHNILPPIQYVRSVRGVKTFHSNAKMLSYSMGVHIPEVVIKEFAYII